MKKRSRLLVFGTAGRTPFAGLAWQVLQYLEGFRRLGCEVFYIEDTGAWPYDPEKNTITSDPSYTVKYLARLMARCGMEDQWAYVSPAAAGHCTLGLSNADLADFCLSGCFSRPQ